jgi:uncharacterized protein YukE
MENNELKTLEQKARNIVTTLENLEKETRDYQKKNLDIVSAISNLINISDNIMIASKELSSSAALFGNSDFSKAINVLDERINKINLTEIQFIDQTKNLNSIVEEVLVEYRNLSREINEVNNSINEFLKIKDTIYETKQLLEIVSMKIERVDRNTQKGFGKEKG